MGRATRALKQTIPDSLKQIIKKTLFFGNRYYCNVCDSNLRVLNPAGDSNNANIELDIIGAGYYTNDVCPVCDSSYRTRSVVALLENIKLRYQNIRILHIAPEKGLYNYFKSRKPLSYVCGDINPEKYSHFTNTLFIDLTNIPFPSDSFDLIICNHVLEHIPNDMKAMREIFRVLSKGGIAVLQVPISNNIDSTLEDPTADTPEKRLVRFGQSDHVRVYNSDDYVSKLEDAGLKVSVISVKSLISDVRHEKLILDKRENLFLCNKPS